ncbi:MAG: hypothetical protein LBM01_03080 [Christensenellaceae bacterium]|jgi:exonuclease VII small subunit|nr:hypothetical protein [Christensenellaceae bacterium]
MDDKIKKIEKLTAELENEKSFDESVKKFAEAATLIKSALAEGEEAKGKVLEIIREVDGITEKELPLD